MDLSKSIILKENNKLVGWTPVFLSVVTGRVSIAYFHRIDDEHIVVAELAIDKLPKLSNRLSELDILVMIVDEHLQLIAHPDSSLSQQQVNLSYLSLFQSQYSTGVYSDTFEWSDEVYFGTVINMDELNWRVIVAEEEESIRKELYNVLQNWLISIIVIIFAALTIGLKRSSSFSKRFAVLTQQAKNIAQGNYQTEVVEEDVREFNELSENVVLMSEAISRREAELHSKEQEVRDMNEVLEHRVEERTRKLSEANAELEKTVVALNSTMDQLVQSEKLASLGSLVAGVAHELNTPIGNAKMASSTLLDFASDIRQKLASGEITKSSLEHFLNDAVMAADIASRNLEKAAELIASFKQVAADQSSSQRRKFKLAELTHEILVTLHPQTKKKAIALQIDIDPELTMDSFPGPLGQVISNLIMNAYLHGFSDQNEGSIQITAKLHEDSVEIQFADDGCGIAEEAISSVFDPFYTTKLGQGGSGLGLHICHNIVTEILGGSIRVTSRKDEGTVFTLLLPVIA
jgi:signal transduction histidine kinase